MERLIHKTGVVVATSEGRTEVRLRLGGKMETPNPSGIAIGEKVVVVYDRFAEKAIGCYLPDNLDDGMTEPCCMSWCPSSGQSD